MGSTSVIFPHYDDGDDDDDDDVKDRHTVVIAYLWWSEDNMQKLVLSFHMWS